MPLESGGRADKQGNRYEISCITYELLKIVSEENSSVVIEALGDDEIATDILVTDNNGIKIHKQCKARNSSMEYWTVSDLNLRGILQNWKFQLDRDCNRKVSLMSAIGCSHIVDLHLRAKNTSENSRDYIDYQIKNSSTEFKKSYYSFCTYMKLDTSNEMDLYKSIDYLKRINIEQMSEYDLNELINQKISFLFTTNRETVRDALTRYIIDGDICGQNITVEVLHKIFDKKGITLSGINSDNMIYPRIKLLNQEYRESFKTLNGGLINRKEFAKCKEFIENETSFVISGGAGYGKSGCTESILNYCEETNIPHLAIKLDRKMPRENSKEWAKKLGLPCTVEYSLHRISLESKAVLIFDQLDSLRWTQSNSAEPLSICIEIIKQIKILNANRKHKIVTVFVCRDFDLKNDNNIKNLFENEDGNSEKWEQVCIGNIDDETVQNIVGEKYIFLDKKLRNILRIPSNLFIWQHLDTDNICKKCNTTYNLIDEWYKQILNNANNSGFEDKNITETLESIISVLDRNGESYIPKAVLNVSQIGLSYLEHSDLVVVNGNKIGFVHQSILDFFISKKMIKDFYINNNIEQIIGDKGKQTPVRRYQVQMFLQYWLEYDSSVFLDAGEEMLKSSEVRYYVKYVFFELLGQVSETDEVIEEYVIKNCMDFTKRNTLIDNVILGRKTYVDILLKNGILEKWFYDDNLKDIVIRLLDSISVDLDDRYVEFIEKHAFVNVEDDERFKQCFYHNIESESDELFELRLKFYNKYPNWIQEFYINAYNLMKHCQIRMIRLMALLLKNQMSSSEKTIYKYEEEFVDVTDKMLVQNGEKILEELIPYIPLEDDIRIKYSSWNGSGLYNKGIERATVELIKKANVALISKNPDFVWRYYERYMGKNYLVFNEIILHFFSYLPENYSNRVIEYITRDFERRIFDYTSSEKDQLVLARRILEVHISSCDKLRRNEFLNALIKYISSTGKERYKQRIEYNRRHKDESVYWSFYGEFQYSLLMCIPYNLLDNYCRELVSVLDRKFNGVIYLYNKENGHAGWVESPVCGKKLGVTQWKQIITNTRIVNRENRKDLQWKEVEGGFIESSLELYARDFQAAVSSNIVDMINMVLSVKKEKIDKIYINSLFYGASMAESINDVEVTVWEKLFSRFPYYENPDIAFPFCEIIRKVEFNSWSKNTVRQLFEIASDYEKIIDTAQENSEELLSKSINCASGYAINALANLLSKNNLLLSQSKDLIDRMIKDNNKIVQFSCFPLLYQINYFDRQWAEERMINLFKLDIRMVGVMYSRNYLLQMYNEYPQDVLQIINTCFMSQDKRLIEIGGYAIGELYITKDEFKDTIINIKMMNKNQKNAIVHMAVCYLNMPEYRNKSKEIILRYIRFSDQISYPMWNIFRDNMLDLESDSEFLIEIMKSNVSELLLNSFITYLDSSIGSLKAYGEIIITLCQNCLNRVDGNKDASYGIVGHISRLVLALYDETVGCKSETYKKIAEKCLDLWDIMFEKQIGYTRALSLQLMDR